MQDQLQQTYTWRLRNIWRQNSVWTGRWSREADLSQSLVILVKFWSISSWSLILVFTQVSQLFCFLTGASCWPHLMIQLSSLTAHSNLQGQLMYVSNVLIPWSWPSSLHFPSALYRKPVCLFACGWSHLMIHRFWRLTTCSNLGSLLCSKVFQLAPPIYSLVLLYTI